MSGETACYNHPSQQAAAKCQKCGQPICNGCFDNAWRRVPIGTKKETGTFCRHCVGDWVEVSMAWQGQVIKTMKSRYASTRVLTIIGLIIGILVGVGFCVSVVASGGEGFGGGIEGGILSGVAGGLGVAWVGMGFGCSLRAFLSGIRTLFSSLRIEDLKTDLIYGLVWYVLVAFMVLLTVGDFAGPIMPLWYLKRRKKDIGEIEAMIESNADILKTLRSADAAQSDPTVQNKISQSADVFVGNEERLTQLQKPLLWFFS